MRHLILMRHAKSDWGDAELSDHDRPLNDRGRRDAPRMAEWLKGQWGLPDLILASTAVRVEQTLAEMCSAWSSQPPWHALESLYLATPESIARTIRSDGLDAQRLLVVGHNPGLQLLACQLAGVSLEFPTAAIAVFEMSAEEWRRLLPSTVRLCDRMRPKALDR
jgi:phosphohistidine phosphatase